MTAGSSKFEFFNSLSSSRLFLRVREWLTLFITAIGLTVGVAGCSSSSLKVEQCDGADWFEIGRVDGRQGREREWLGEHVSVCSKAGVAADQLAYGQGHLIGLETYCSPENGFAVGLAGSWYRHVCPRGLEREFIKQLNLGREARRLKAEAEECSSRLQGNSDRSRFQRTTSRG